MPHLRLFSLYLRRKKGYKRAVPICPRCNATIHTGAEDQCPACGYSLLRADAIFGDRSVEFTRVLDEAGALKHHERLELLRALEDMERNIAPIALCIYITDDGRAQNLRTHAHWVLNHAIINHPSFGRREKSRAIEDAAFAERMPGEIAERRPVAPVGWWQRMQASLRDVLHPYPPPVRQEWMLILVMDVQLEQACFAWGYMLDPYINPDSINSCIIGARLQFRERDIVGGLRRVMRSAVSRIASQSHGVNWRLRRAARLMPLVLGAAVALHPAPSGAQAASPWAEDEAAEEVVDDAPAADAPLPSAPQTSAGGAAASLTEPPRWEAEDYRHLLSGELAGAYKMLQSPGGVVRAEPSQPRGGRTRTPESDAKIAKHYYPAYSVADSSSIIDPQKLLSSVEWVDVGHVLHTLNAHAPYHLYVGIYRSGQEVPLELAVGSLVRAVARPGEYAAMIMYGMGDAPELDLGYHEIRLSDEDRHAWLEKVRQAAAKLGGVEGLIAAAHELHRCLTPVAAELPPLTQQTAVQVPLIPVEMRDDPVADEVTLRDEIQGIINNPAMRPILWTLGGIVGFVGLVVSFIMWRRRSGKLMQSMPDIRLSSPYGAGVSRTVRYLEGKEASKSIYML